MSHLSQHHHHPGPAPLPAQPARAAFRSGPPALVAATAAAGHNNNSNATGSGGGVASNDKSELTRRTRENRRRFVESVHPSVWSASAGLAALSHVDGPRSVRAEFVVFALLWQFRLISLPHSRPHTSNRAGCHCPEIVHGILTSWAADPAVRRLIELTRLITEPLDSSLFQLAKSETDILNSLVSACSVRAHFGQTMLWHAVGRFVDFASIRGSASPDANDYEGRLATFAGGPFIASSTASSLSSSPATTTTTSSTSTSSASTYSSTSSSSSSSSALGTSLTNPVSAMAVADPAAMDVSSRGRPSDTHPETDEEEEEEDLIVRPPDDGASSPGKRAALDEGPPVKQQRTERETASPLLRPVKVEGVKEEQHPEIGDKEKAAADTLLHLLFSHDSSHDVHGFQPIFTTSLPGSLSMGGHAMAPTTYTATLSSPSASLPSSLSSSPSSSSGGSTRAAEGSGSLWGMLKSRPRSDSGIRRAASLLKAADHELPLTWDKDLSSSVSSASPTLSPAIPMTSPPSSSSSSSVEPFDLSAVLQRPYHCAVIIQVALALFGAVRGPQGPWAEIAQLGDTFLQLPVPRLGGFQRPRGYGGRREGALSSGCLFVRQSVCDECADTVSKGGKFAACSRCIQRWI